MDKSRAYERTSLGIAIAVTAVWVIATLVQIVAPNHPVPVTVNATMGLVATFFFSGAYYWARRRDGRENGKPSAPPGRRARKPKPPLEESTEEST